MYVWSGGQFVQVQVQDGGFGTAHYVVQVADRALQVGLDRDALVLVQTHGHGADLQTLAAIHGVQGYSHGRAQPVLGPQLQALWTAAYRDSMERTAAQILYLLLAARHRQLQLDVASMAASLHKSAHALLTALRLLHSYGAIRMGQGQAPEPADATGSQMPLPVALASDPPDLARLGAFADALYQTGQALELPDAADGDR